MKSWIFEKLMDYYMVITCSIFFYHLLLAMVPMLGIFMERLLIFVERQ